MEKIKQQIKERYDIAEDKISFINELREFIHNDLFEIHQPIDLVKWVPVEQIQPNDYNPNSVAKVEMGLLYKSIKFDGYTQPIVTIYDDVNKKYVIVDGFHRYFVGKNSPDIMEITHNCLPVTVIKKGINDRMASTIRHNRARGEHSVEGMSNMVFELLQNGWSDEDICNHLGMEAEEILKLKHITGFSKLFENVEYKKSWETKNMIKYRKEHKE